MERTDAKSYLAGFVPYALAALLIGMIGGFTTVLGPAFVEDLGFDYNNTSRTSLALSISAAVLPVYGDAKERTERGEIALGGIANQKKGVGQSSNARFLILIIRKCAETP